MFEGKVRVESDDIIVGGRYEAPRSDGNIEKSESSNNHVYFETYTVSALKTRQVPHEQRLILLHTLPHSNKHARS